MAEAEAEELAKKYHDEKKGKANSNKGKKIAPKKKTVINAEEPEPRIPTLSSKKRACPTLVKKKASKSDSNIKSKQKEPNECDEIIVKVRKMTLMSSSVPMLTMNA